MLDIATLRRLFVMIAASATVGHFTGVWASQACGTLGAYALAGFAGNMAAMAMDWLHLLWMARYRGSNA
jgi:hypothetical protein